jgi:hypothetical protein
LNIPGKGEYLVTIYKRDVQISYVPPRGDIFEAKIESDPGYDFCPICGLSCEDCDCEEKKTRGAIKEFSERSRKRLAFFAGNCSVQFSTMETLTVQADIPIDCREFKSALNSYLQSYRRRKILYLWFFEFTKKGVPHVHVLSDKSLPDSGGQTVNIYESQKQSVRWSRLIQSALSPEKVTGDVCEYLDRMNSASVRSEQVECEDGAARYATKYAMKMEQKDVPEGMQDVGRFWGHSRSIRCDPLHRCMMTEKELRESGFKFYEYEGPEGIITGPCSIQYNKGETADDWL